MEEYVDRTRKGQNDIYYITGESIAFVSALFSREPKRKSYEVLYKADPVDEYCMQQLKEFWEEG